jgi:site-specific recombinase XerD
MSPAIVIASLPDFSTYVSSTLGRSPHTAKAYVSDIRCLARFLSRRESANDQTIAPLPADLSPSFVTWLRVDERNCSATVKRKMAALHIYFTWLVRTGKIERSPIEGSTVEIRLPKRLPRAVARQDVIRLLAGCNPTNEVKVWSETELALRLLVATGVRISELCSINLGDVSPDGSAIRIRGKGSRERTVFLSNLDLQKRLALACGLMPVAEPGIRPLFKGRRGICLTPQAYRLRLHQLRLSTGLGVRVTPHCLRHTAATLLIEAGVDIRFVQRLLGHASIATTEIYTRVVDESLRKALLSADPMRGM